MPSKRSSYPLEFKLEVIKRARTTTIHGAAKKYNVTRKQIRTWKGVGSAVRELAITFPLLAGKEARTAGKARPADDGPDCFLNLFDFWHSCCSSVDLSLDFS